MNNPFGLSSLIESEIKKILQDHLVGKTSYAVHVFGSRSTGRFREFSDLDLWIESLPPLSGKEKADLHDLFSESNIPIKIDIVTAETCLPEYIQGIATQRKLWFVKSSA